MWNEFKKFAIQGNAMDLAVGVTIGAAFGRIVSSLVEDVLMPPLGLIIGKVDFSNLFLSLTGELLPEYYGKVFLFSQPAMFAEIAFMLWLVIKGAQPPAPAAAASSSAA